MKTVRGGGSSPTQHQHKTLTHLSIPPPPPPPPITTGGQGYNNHLAVNSSNISPTKQSNQTSTISQSNPPSSPSPLSLKGSLLSSYDADIPPPLSRDPHTGKFTPPVAMPSGSNSPVHTNSANITQQPPQQQSQPRKSIIGSLSRGLGFGGSK